MFYVIFLKIIKRRKKKEKYIIIMRLFVSSFREALTHDCMVQSQFLDVIIS